MYVSTFSFSLEIPKGVTDPKKDGSKPTCFCWEFNSGTQEDQALLLKAELYLEPFFAFS